MTRLPRPEFGESQRISTSFGGPGPTPYSISVPYPPLTRVTYFQTLCLLCFGGEFPAYVLFQPLTSCFHQNLPLPSDPTEMNHLVSVVIFVLLHDFAFDTSHRASYNVSSVGQISCATFSCEEGLFPAGGSRRNDSTDLYALQPCWSTGPIFSPDPDRST